MKVLLCLEDGRNTYKQECYVAYIYTLVFDSSDLHCIIRRLVTSAVPDLGPFSNEVVVWSLVLIDIYRSQPSVSYIVSPNLCIITKQRERSAHRLLLHKII
jgi:hypothetical protein